MDHAELKSRGRQMPHRRMLISAGLATALWAAFTLPGASEAKQSAHAVRIWTGALDRPNIRLSIEVHEFGEGVPILFVHGWTMDRRDEMADYEPLFADIPGWQRLYPDLPGMGRSKAERIDDLDAILDALSFVVEQRIRDRPFAVAGTSAGAYLADALASRYPGQVMGILFRAPLTVPVDRARDIGTIRRVAPLSASGLTSGNSEGAPFIAAPAYQTDLARKERDRVAPAQALAQRELLDPIRRDTERYVLRAPLIAGNQPALIMAARQDASVGYRDAWSLAERYPRATFAAIDRAEHGFPIDEANRKVFEALVRDWLFRVGEYVGAGTRP